MPIIFKIVILFLGVGFLAYLALGVFDKSGKRKKTVKSKENGRLGFYVYNSENRAVTAGKNNYQKSKQTKKTEKYIWLKRIFWLLVFLFMVGVITAISLFIYYSKDLPNPGKINKRVVIESTKIYDRTGEHLLYELYGEEKRTVVPIENIPETVKKATIVLEDNIFYSHHGFDAAAITKAACYEISSKIGLGDLGGLCPKRGGSTITQQFIKNSLLTSERRYSRKIKELILAIEIENKFSKDDILGMYLNEIPYGSNSYGIEAAAKTFFGVSVGDLTLAQAALLACLPNAPSYYSPYGSHTDKLLNRWTYALDRMYELGYITEEQKESAKNEDILSQVKPLSNILQAPHFSMYVKEKLEEQFGEKELQSKGLKVYTTLDWDLQKKAENIVLEGVNAEGAKWRFSNAALVAVNPQNGQVLAMAGSKDYWDKSIDGNVNVATRLRQPGSSFKPYIYARAFQEGYTPDTIIYDVPTNFGKDGSGNYYRPNNYDGSFHGPMKMKEALARSLNIPAVKALYLVGIKDAISQVELMGINTLKNPHLGLSLVLGGGEVKLLEHVGAFGVFGAEGIKHEQKVVLRIEDNSGNEVANYEKSEGKRVLERNSALQITEILSDDNLRKPTFGANSKLNVPGHQVAVKTGTTNDFKDGWTIGTTPSLTVGVWAGNNNSSSMRVGADGIYVAGPIWNKFMTEALANKQDEKFAEPVKIEAGKDVLDGKIKNEVKEIKVCKVKKDKYCVPKDGDCGDKDDKKKKFFIGHSILYYVDKDDPRGDQPKKPKNDPQFEKWEEGVVKWGEKHADDKGRDALPDDC